MEDDEEYSYSAYSARTGTQLKERELVTGDDEEYSYSAYAGETAVTEAEERTQSYGDFIIEEFSAETNVPRLAKLTRIPANIVTYIFAVVYAVVGALCVCMTDEITQVLPYVVGGMMVLIGFVRFVRALISHEYRHLRTNRTATSLIVTALGIMILVQHVTPENDSAITFISIVWGILGLFEGAHAFNHAFKRIANSERCVYYLIKGLIECIVAFMLLYEPDNHDTHHFHIIVFGAQLIFDAITMIPQVKSFLAMK